MQTLSRVLENDIVDCANKIPWYQPTCGITHGLCLNNAYERFNRLYLGMVRDAVLLDRMVRNVSDGALEQFSICYEQLQSPQNIKKLYEITDNCPTTTAQLPEKITTQSPTSSSTTSKQLPDSAATTTEPQVEETTASESPTTSEQLPDSSTTTTEPQSEETATTGSPTVSEQPPDSSTTTTQPQPEETTITESP